jgi:hypothetical protein
VVQLSTTKKTLDFFRHKPWTFSRKKLLDFVLRLRSFVQPCQPALER